MEIDLASERDFHNGRFTGGDKRDDKKKYYWALDRYAKLFERKVTAMALGADVLELGCSNGDQLPQLAHCKSYQGIDISDVAVARAKARAPSPKFQFHVMDAMHTNFPDESFDLVLGVGVIHHLDTADAAREVSRVLRPGGRAIFWEPLGLNPVLGLYRLLTPAARTKGEHPLRPKDLHVLRRTFTSVEANFAGMTCVAAVPFQRTRAGAPLRRALGFVDDVLLALPGLRYLAWFAIVVLQKSPAPSAPAAGNRQPTPA